MEFYAFCAAIAAYTDMFEAGFITEACYLRNINRLWSRAA